MKSKNTTLTLSLLISLVLTSCAWDVVDSDGLLITDNDEAYMASFDIVGTDNRSLLVSHEINEEEKTVHAIARYGTDLTTIRFNICQIRSISVHAIARYGTDLTNVKPYSSVALDALVRPAMGQFVDFSEPREYTVISGNRQVENTYTIYISVQE